MEGTEKKGSKWEVGLRRSMQLYTSDRGRTTRGWVEWLSWQGKLEQRRKGRCHQITASSSGLLGLKESLFPESAKRWGIKNCTQLQNPGSRAKPGNLLPKRALHVKTAPEQKCSGNHPVYPTQMKGRVTHCRACFQLQFKLKFGGKKPLNQCFPVYSHSLLKAFTTIDTQIQSFRTNSKFTFPQDFQLWSLNFFYCLILFLFYFQLGNTISLLVFSSV